LDKDDMLKMFVINLNIDIYDTFLVIFL